MQIYRLETMSSYNEKAPSLFLEVGIDRFGDGKPYYFKTDLRTVECDNFGLSPGNLSICLLPLRWMIFVNRRNEGCFFQERDQRGT